MPEGQEVKIIVEVLKNNIKPQKLLRIKINNDNKYVDINKYTQISFIDVTCKGKQIFFKFIDNDNNKIYLNCHLGLTGKWLFSSSFSTEVSLIFETITIYFVDSSRYGRLKWLTEEKYQAKLKTIGPDLLVHSLGENNLDLKLWTLLLKNKRIKKKQISDYLLTQKYISGIGNYLKSEILYSSMIRPDRSLDSLTDKDIELLYSTSKRIILESYNNGGFTFKDYIDPSGLKGKFKPLVYGRKKDNNGYTIVVDTFKDNRKSYWVKEVQK